MAPLPPAKVGGKNRPTPTRSSAQAARRRPLVPTDRKAAARTQRDAARTQRAVASAGMLAGDERYLMGRDRGPVRRHVRDVVDARRNTGENLIIIALAVLLLQFLLAVVLQDDPQAAAAWASVSSLLLPGVFLVIIIDSVLLRRRVRSSVSARFGPAAAEERGLSFYGITRALQMRRARRPAPAVPRGGSPR